MRQFILILPLVLLGCASRPPVDEYAIARTALEAARDQEAARFAPNYWHQAEESYLQGETLYRKGEYKDAELQFITSREFSEKAENATRVQKFKSGE